MKNAKIYRRFAVENTIFDLPLVLSVFFFWSIFRNFRVIGGDTEHERIFLGRQPRACGWNKKTEKKHTEHERMRTFATTEHERKVPHARTTH